MEQSAPWRSLSFSRSSLSGKKLSGMRTSAEPAAIFHMNQSNRLFPRPLLMPSLDINAIFVMIEASLSPVAQSVERVAVNH